jgi:RNA polymerase sigma factor (sigma-70 family)
LLSISRDAPHLDREVQWGRENIMATASRPANLLRQLEVQPPADGELLELFLRGDDAAFAALVRRHGPMVLAVARRITNHAQDAEDAFQAAFLILAKKAAAIRAPGLLGNWLYGVAARVAQKARRTAARRRAREVQVVNAPEPVQPQLESLAEIGPVLHEELARLPERYREAIVLCDLRGLPRAEAAKALAIPEGTLSSRLAGGRKKLADRLARRGVALPAASLPLLLAEGTLSAAVPEPLATRTCELAAAWRAGAALPPSILRLTQGSLIMRKTFLLGLATTLVAAAGVLFAAQPQEPKPEAEKPRDPAAPVVAEEAAAPRPAEKAPEFAARPKLRQTADLNISAITNVVWSPDGKYLAVSGTGNPPDHGGHRVALVIPALAGKSEPRLYIEQQNASSLVGFTPDGEQVITDLRESGLVSGVHRLEFWDERAGGPQGAGVRTKTVDLDSERTYGYAFAADGKSYRTLALTMVNGRIANPQIREVSMQTGATTKTLLRLEGEYGPYGSVALSNNGSRLIAGNDDCEITAYDVTSGKKLWTKTPDLGQKDLDEGSVPPRLKGGASRGAATQIEVGVSADGKIVFTSLKIGRPLLLNGDTGEPLPPLEGIELASCRFDPHCFSSGDRLLAMSGKRYVKSEGNGGFGGGRPGQIVLTGARDSFLTVWDTRTGKVMKSWSGGSQPIVAFHPTKPILAVLEANNNQTRLGFWDFSADIPMKK